jgi:hypothetical protein
MDVQRIASPEPGADLADALDMPEKLGVAFCNAATVPAKRHLNRDGSSAACIKLVGVTRKLKALLALQRFPWPARIELSALVLQDDFSP